MRHNRQPVLLASRLQPTLIDLRDGWRPLVVCNVCRRWTVVRRGMFMPHRNDDATRSISDGKVVSLREADENAPRCPGSGQRIRIDLTTDEWRALLQRFLADASPTTDTRRPTTVHRRPRPAAPQAVMQIAATRKAQLEGTRR